MVDKIEQVATDYFCCYQIHNDLVVFDSNEIDSDVLLEYNIEATQYFPSMVDDDWIVEFMENCLLRPSNNTDWVDEDFSQIVVFRIKNV